MYGNNQDKTQDKIYEDRYWTGQLERQMSYRNEKLEGPSRFWHVDGQIWRQMFYKNGGREGECKIWHANGQLYEQKFYQNDRQEGKSKVWHVDGKLMEQEYYRDGTLEGEYRFWGYDGAGKSYCYFKNGRLLDLHFNRKKRDGFLSVKRHLQIPHISLVFDSHLIPDLSQMITRS